MFELLKEILVDDLQLSAEELRPDADREEVGLDSLAAVELAEVLAHRHGIEIADYEVLHAATLGDLAALLAERSAVTW